MIPSSLSRLRGGFSRFKPRLPRPTGETRRPSRAQGNHLLVVVKRTSTTPFRPTTKVPNTILLAKNGKKYARRTHVQATLYPSSRVASANAKVTRPRMLRAPGTEADRFHERFDPLR